MPLSESDRRQLLTALDLARSSFGLTEPNPRVGCVIARPDGTLLGQGATQAAGSHHAEVMALRDAAAAGHDVRGATAWVTLEPCAHHGRTPPCCDALIAAGLARCVVALGDPHPGVAGQGLARMRAAGMTVDVLEPSDELAEAAREVNLGFLSRIERGRPWVRAKMAASADGRTALPNGQSKWITGKAARADGHHWRKRASAVLTGIGTVLADDPRLDVREVHTPRQPLRIVVDSQLRMPTSAALLQVPGPVLVVGLAGAPDRAAALREAGAQVWEEPPNPGSTHQRVNLPALLGKLAAQGVNEIHLEAGPTLTGAFHREDLIDEWLLYLAPMLLGPGRPLLESPALPGLDQALRGRWASATAVGEDLRLRLWN